MTKKRINRERILGLPGCKVGNLLPAEKHDKEDFILVEHLLGAHSAERLDSQRAGDVVSQYTGKRTFHDLPDFTDFLVRVHLQDLLGKSHCHIITPIWISKYAEK